MAEMTWQSQLEIDEERLLKSLEPSEQEIKDAELEIKVLNILQEVQK